MPEVADRRVAKADVHGAALVVDDDLTTLSGLSQLLRRRGVQTYEASTGEGAVRSALAHRPDVLVVDNRLGSPGEMTGIDVIDALHARSFYPTWILYSGFMDYELATDAGRRNVFRVISLPSDEIETAVMKALSATHKGEAGGWPIVPVGQLSLRPQANAGKGATWILAACDSTDDLPTFSAWAGTNFVDSSERRMRELYEQLGLDPQRVKSFMRIFRALARTRGHVEHAIAELIVGDPRTLKRLRDDGGLNAPSAARIPLEQFLRTQRFVPSDHSMLIALRSLIATRNLPVSFKS